MCLQIRHGAPQRSAGVRATCLEVPSFSWITELCLMQWERWSLQLSWGALPIWAQAGYAGFSCKTAFLSPPCHPTWKAYKSLFSVEKVSFCISKGGGEKSVAESSLAMNYLTSNIWSI